jgi:DNA-binding NtrC family response regulator
MSDGRILIVDDEESMCQFLAIMLRKEGFTVHAVTSGVEALKEMKKNPYDIVMTDIQMPRMDGIQVLSGVKAIDPAVPVIIMTAYASQKTAIEAVNKGAFHYLNKHAKNDEIKMVVRNALEVKKVKSENVQLKRALSTNTRKSTRLIGKSDEIQKVLRLVDKIAVAESNVLIYGESGTGKELIACSIHEKSHRANGPFITINCGALPESLLESELFGHVKGSFTNAIRDKEGLFKVACGGTFFLDEIGETSPAIQVKLLRAIQEREIIPVGGTKPIKVDTRIIAATNRDLEREVRLGNFRADLYYRLNVIQVTLPPLRDRADDIPLLIDHFLKQYKPNYEGNVKSAMTGETLEILQNHSWPGNVRELENVIERAVILQEQEDFMTPVDLPEKLYEGEQGGGALNLHESGITLEELEKKYMIKVLAETGWHKKKAAEILGINPSTLYRKIKAYGLVPPGGASADGSEFSPEEEEEIIGV